MKVGTVVPCFVLMVLTSSCENRQPATTAGSPFSGADATGVVARVQGEAISLEKFQRTLLQRGSATSKEALLDEMIRERALVAKAKAAGYDRNPELLAAFESMIAARFEEDQLAKGLSEAARVSDAQIEEAYHRDAAKYRTPAQARGGVIFLAVGARASAETRAEVKQRAEAVLAEATHADAGDYAQLVQRHSEEQATRYIGGDTGWLIPRDQRHESRWEAPVIDTIFSLAKPGELAPLISTARGFYIVRLTEAKPASVRPLEEVKEGIRYQLTQAKQHQLRLELFDEARRGAKVEINQAALDLIPEPTNRMAVRPPALPGG